MESMVSKEFWSNKKVLVTGHTGFKGAWLFYWLRMLGAEVHGYSLEPLNEPSLFYELNLNSKKNDDIGNILDLDRFSKKCLEVMPDIVFHLAAQPLVRKSYKEPGLTWQTNVLGTINLMESIRQINKRIAVVVITTDKVYKNREWDYAYRETDALGGYDPYSSSKAGCEIAVSSWRNSFFRDSEINIATARAGNVIGGGDWSEDRILPDLIKAVVNGEELIVRNSSSVRPWQHVLDPLGGYLNLGQKLFESNEPALQSSFNFGPSEESFRTVADLVNTSLKIMPGTWSQGSENASPHEAKLLSLTIQKAKKTLDWSPQWDFEESVFKTMQWYIMYIDGVSACELVSNQIDEYNAS